MDQHFIIKCNNERELLTLKDIGEPSYCLPHLWLINDFSKQYTYPVYVFANFDNKLGLLLDDIKEDRDFSDSIAYLPATYIFKTFKEFINNTPFLIAIRECKIKNKRISVFKNDKLIQISVEEYLDIMNNMSFYDLKSKVLVFREEKDKSEENLELLQSKTDELLCIYDKKDLTFTKKYNINETNSIIEYKIIPDKIAEKIDLFNDIQRFKEKEIDLDTIDEYRGKLIGKIIFSNNKHKLFKHGSKKIFTADGVIEYDKE